MKLIACKVCGSKNITLSDCGHSAFNIGGGKCDNGHGTTDTCGCMPTQHELSLIWNRGQQLTRVEKLEAENKRLRKKIRDMKVEAK